MALDALFNEIRTRNDKCQKDLGSKKNELSKVRQETDNWKESVDKSKKEADNFEREAEQWNQKTSYWKGDGDNEYDKRAEGKETKQQLMICTNDNSTCHEYLAGNATALDRCTKKQGQIDGDLSSCNDRLKTCQAELFEAALTCDTRVSGMLLEVEDSWTEACDIMIVANFSVCAVARDEYSTFLQDCQREKLAAENNYRQDSATAAKNFEWRLFKQAQDCERKLASLKVRGDIGFCLECKDCTVRENCASELDTCVKNLDYCTKERYVEAIQCAESANQNEREYDQKLAKLEVFTENCLPLDVEDLDRFIKSRCPACDSWCKD